MKMLLSSALIAAMSVAPPIWAQNGPPTVVPPANPASGPGDNPHAGTPESKSGPIAAPSDAGK